MRICMLVSLAVIAAMLPARADKVYVGGRPIVGKVVKDTVEKVVVRIGGNDTEFRQEDVTKIEYDPTPPEFHRAEGMRRQGQYEEAAESYRSCLEASYHPQLKQYLLYGLGDSFYRSGEDEEAKKVFDALLEEFPDTRFLVESAEAIVQLYLKTGVERRGEMERYIEIVEDSDPRRAALIRARVAEQINDDSDAMKWYRKVVDESGRDEEMHWEARTGLARLAMKRNDYTAFQTQFQEALSTPELVPDHIMAELYLNAARDARERSRDDRDLLDRALSLYVRVFSLYDTGSTRAMSAEAAFQAGVLSELIASRGDHPQLKDEAQRLFRYVVSQYGDTRWSRDAKSRLK